MYDDLLNLYNELSKIKVYLVKIGPSRRKGEIISKKLSEADNLVSNFNSILEELASIPVSFKGDECLRFDKLSNDFFNLYDTILKLCNTESCENYNKMSKFELKVALQLLPVIDDSEISVKQLIDNIIYYDSLLTSPDCKNNLIQFILKSRLSQNAKLQLQPNYTAINDLVSDMRRVLLPQKSPIAIQNKIQQLRQNNRSVQDYGKEMSELFVDLTISQSKGDSNAYAVLKPLNVRDRCNFIKLGWTSSSLRK
ncbi:uncharacterized protein LOC123877311 [Maniola jurtina]|uniref:uncharacterized protein LOC123877311 n=1 Tax=Maniola jurtina TaxID=191418 RepID=UPI001E68B3A0|nr:uncharacterized protein LOC123877311 [Maniola jurtina]